MDSYMYEYLSDSVVFIYTKILSRPCGDTDTS